MPSPFNSKLVIIPRFRNIKFSKMLTTKAKDKSPTNKIRFTTLRNEHKRIHIHCVVFLIYLNIFKIFFQFRELVGNLCFLSLTSWRTLLFLQPSYPSLNFSPLYPYKFQILGHSKHFYQIVYSIKNRACELKIHRATTYQKIWSSCCA